MTWKGRPESHCLGLQYEILAGMSFVCVWACVCARVCSGGGRRRIVGLPGSLEREEICWTSVKMSQQVHILVYPLCFKNISEKMITVRPLKSINICVRNRREMESSGQG